MLAGGWTWVQWEGLKCVRVGSRGLAEGRGGGMGSGEPERGKAGSGGISVKEKALLEERCGWQTKGAPVDNGER